MNASLVDGEVERKFDVTIWRVTEDGLRVIEHWDEIKDVIAAAKKKAMTFRADRPVWVR